MSTLLLKDMSSLKITSPLNVVVPDTSRFPSNVVLPHTSRFPFTTKSPTDDDKSLISFLIASASNIILFFSFTFPNISLFGIDIIL